MPAGRKKGKAKRVKGGKSGGGRRGQQNKILLLLSSSRSSRARSGIGQSSSPNQTSKFGARK